jgi:hypothetical protein
MLVSSRYLHFAAFFRKSFQSVLFTASQQFLFDHFPLRFGYQSVFTPAFPSSRPEGF